MNQSEASLPDSRRFCTTPWSKVLAASQPDTEAGAAALAVLLEKYRRPLNCYLVRRFRWQEADAEDLLHNFIHDKLMLKNLVGRAKRKRGKFRTFLLSSLETFVKEQIRNSTRLKRRPDGGFVPLEEVSDTEGGTTTCEASRMLDLEWARAVLADTLRQMEAECHAEKRGDIWRAFRSRILLPIIEGTKKADYSELVQDGGFSSPEAVSTALTTGKRKFIRILKKVVIGEYATDDHDVEAEFRELMAILAEGS